MPEGFLEDCKLSYLNLAQVEPADRFGQLSLHQHWHGPKTKRNLPELTMQSRAVDSPIGLLISLATPWLS